MIKHKLWVLCASFEGNCAQTRTFSNTPFNMKGNHFLVHGTEKGFILVFVLFKYVKYVIIFLRIRHSASHFFTETDV